MRPAMQPTDLSADTPMGAILETLPGAKRALFARYHLGGCQSCAFSNDETLAQLCERSELPVAEVLEHLLASHVHDSAMLMEPAAAREKLAEFRLIDLRTREEHEAVAIAGSEFFTQELQQQLFAGDPETRDPALRSQRSKRARSSRLVSRAWIKTNVWNARRDRCLEPGSRPFDSTLPDRNGRVGSRRF